MREVLCTSLTCKELYLDLENIYFKSAERSAIAQVHAFLSILPWRRDRDSWRGRDEASFILILAYHYPEGTNSGKVDTLRSHPRPMQRMPSSLSRHANMPTCRAHMNAQKHLAFPHRYMEQTPTFSACS